MKALEKTIKKLMGILKVSKSNLYILKNLFIHNGFINITNLDTFIQIKTTIKETFFVNGDLFKKSLSLLTSKTDKFSPDDYPCFIGNIENKREIPANLFFKSLKHMISFTADDISRPQLTTINVQPDFAGWSTDGHRACIDHSLLSPVPLSLSPEFINCIDTLLSAGETVKKAYVSNGKDITIPEDRRKQLLNRLNIVSSIRDKFSIELNKLDYGDERYDSLYDKLRQCDRMINNLENILNEYSNIVNYKYIQIETDNCIVTSKMGDYQFPDIKKVVPIHDQNEIILTEDMASILHDAIKTIMPYSNEKTFLINFEGNTIFCKNEESAVKIVLPFETFSFKIGVNSKYLLEILSHINSGCIIRYKTAISAIYLSCENEPDFLIMPLRIIEDDYGKDDQDYKVETPKYKSLQIERTPQKRKKLSKQTNKKYSDDLLTACSLLIEAKENNDISSILECIDLVSDALQVTA